MRRLKLGNRFVTIFHFLVNGGWTAWSEWSDCSATCGTGLSLRSRSCTNPASVAGGSDCAGESVETMECDIASCPGKSDLF